MNRSKAKWKPTPKEWCTLPRSWMFGTITFSQMFVNIAGSSNRERYEGRSATEAKNWMELLTSWHPKTNKNATARVSGWRKRINEAYKKQKHNTLKFITQPLNTRLIKKCHNMFVLVVKAKLTYRPVVEYKHKLKYKSDITGDLSTRPHISKDYSCNASTTIAFNCKATNAYDTFTLITCM